MCVHHGVWVEVCDGVCMTNDVCCGLFTINFVGFCQRTNRQRANHTVSEERGGDYRAMASSQGVLSEGEKREKEGGF